MANNRLQIYCVKCKEMQVLAKYYPIDWTVPDDIGHKINDFLGHHQKCFLESADINFGTDMFKFRTEADEDGLVTDYRKEPYRVIEASEYNNSIK